MDHMQRTTCNGQDATCNRQPNRKRCNRPHATMQQTTDHRKHAELRPTADNVQHARDNGEQTQHAPHNMQHATGKRQQTTDHRSKHDTMRDRQHATYDKQRQTTRNNATDIPRHRGHLNRVAGAAAGESRHTRASRAATAHLFKHSMLRRPCRLRL